MTKQKNLNDQASFSAPIEDLQVRITFLDDLVEQLNEQVSLQHAEIADLKKQMQFLYFIISYKRYFNPISRPGRHQNYASCNIFFSG